MMEDEEHRKRHELLHKSLDELLADFIEHNKNKGFSNTTIMELLEWSARQAREPDKP